VQTDSDLALDTAGWHPRATQLYRYWRSIHPCPGLLPGRQHFDPVAVPELLPAIWLLDVARDPFRLRYRLCGTAVVGAIGREVTGLWLDEAHSDGDATAEYIARCRRLVREGAPSWDKGPPRLWPQRDVTLVESLLLPLARDGRTIDMLCAYGVPYNADGSVAF
jgi:PAS domain